MGNKHPHHGPGEDEPAHPQGRLNHELSRRAIAVGRHPHTEEGRRSYESLAAILVGPAYRIARARLEAILPRDQVGPDEINAVVGTAMYELYRKLAQGDYRPGTPLIPWFAAIVSTCARDFGRHHPAA